MSKTTFSICTLTSACDTKLAQKTDVVVTLVPSPGDEDSVRSKPISWKVLTFHAESAANHSLTINPEIAVCTVKEEENGILTPQLSKTLMKGGQVVLKPAKEGSEIYWESASHAFSNDSFTIKNECEDTRLALCLFEEDDVKCQPIVDLGTLPQGQQFTINGPLYLQAYAMVEPTAGMPLELMEMGYTPLLEPMVINDLPESAFILYTERNGVPTLQHPECLAFRDVQC